MLARQLRPRSGRLLRMTLNNILATIDAEISLLQEARALLSGADSSTPSKDKSKPRRKGTMSEEGRKHVADEQRKRWAAQKKAAK